MSVKAWGGGLKALADMSAKNVSFFWTAPLIFKVYVFLSEHSCSEPTDPINGHKDCREDDLAVQVREVIKNNILFCKKTFFSLVFF